jgi:hypothetical protein
MVLNFFRSLFREIVRKRFSILKKKGLTKNSCRYMTKFIDLIFLETEQVTHLFLFFLRLRFGLRGGGSGGLGGSGGGGSNGEGIGVLDTLLEGLGLLEDVVGTQSDGYEVLVGVEDDVREGRERGIVKSEGEGSNIGNSGGEGLEKVGGGGLEEPGGVHEPLVEDVGELQTVGERAEVQHLHERGFGAADLLSFLAKVYILQNFDATSGDLGRNVEGGEEGGFSGLKGGDLLGDEHILRGDDASLGLGRNTRLQKLLSEAGQLFLGEDETNVSTDDREDSFPLRVVGQLVLNGLPHEGLRE